MPEKIQKIYQHPVRLGFESILGNVKRILTRLKNSKENIRASKSTSGVLS